MSFLIILHNGKKRILKIIIQKSYKKREVAYNSATSRYRCQSVNSQKLTKSISSFHH